MITSPTINSVHGRIFVHLAPDPAANEEVLITVPANRTWRIIAFRLSLVTDANVADRTVNLYADDGTSEFLFIANDQTQAANLTRFYYFYQGYHAQRTVGPRLYMPIPELILPAGSRIQTNTVNRQAGDNWAVPHVLVEEWIDPT